MTNSRSKPPLNLARVFYQFERIRALTFTLLLRGSFSSFGPRARIDPPLRYSNLHEVVIGAGTNINRFCWIGAVGPPLVDHAPKLVIGPRCGIGVGATITAAQSVTLGERVFTARNVYISDHGHEYRDPDRSIADQGITEPRPVRIDDDTWLGQNACVLPGVTIGRHCIVGANSVVTKDVPDFSVVAGVPAVLIRRYDVNAKQWLPVGKS